MRKNASAFVAIMTILASSVLLMAPSQASVKAGTKCAKKGITNVASGKTYTCEKSGNSLAWNSGVFTNKPIPSIRPSLVPSPSAKPIPIETFGSIGMPVPSGTSLKIGNLAYMINSVSFNVDSAVCAANSFNSGCTLDDNLNAIVDPASTTTWVDVNFSVQNSSSDIANPAGFLTGFDLVLPSGQLLQNQDFIAGYPLLSDVQIIPGGTGTGSILFRVPKNVSSLKSFLVLRDSSIGFSSHDYYFKISW